MAMLAELVEVVIGVDTHKHTHTAAVVAAATGATTVTMTVAATAAGSQQLLELADQHDRRRVWAIEAHRRLRRRPDPVPDRASRASGGAGPA
jgi:transposase